MHPAHDEVDVVVVGAGVVGLACAAELAARGRSVVILERNARIAEETSTRNSGVIHAGIYYEPGSLKAELCVEGRELLYARCERDGIAHRRCEKLIVATDEHERALLEKLLTRGLNNGAGALRMLDASELRALEPNVRGIAAVLSPLTGIVDAFELADSYKRQALSHGAVLALRTQVLALHQAQGAWLVTSEHTNGERTTVHARAVVNAAGLHASRVLELAGLTPATLGLATHYCKGDYFELSPRLKGLVSRLVYPMPAQAGLGIHVTLDLSGNLRAGPDTEYIDALRYDVNADKASAFAAAVQRYLPAVQASDVSPGYAGVRPKLQRAGEPARDFVIAGPSVHGLDGLVCLLGIESPGLTASEAIARRVASIVVGTL